MRRSSLRVVLAAALALVACASPDAGAGPCLTRSDCPAGEVCHVGRCMPEARRDAGDAAIADGGRAGDADVLDADTLDGGEAGDAGDADVLGADAGDPGDAGPADAGPVDAGPADAGPADAGPLDAGPPPGATIVEVSVGGDSSCARRADGRVWCWGGNFEGTLGDGTTLDRPRPVAVVGLDDATSIRTAGHHTCAIRSDRSVWCWGSNENGALGDGTSMMRTTPVQVFDVNDAVSLAAGRHHVCAERGTSGGPIHCWGQNYAGQLGDGTLVSRSRPGASVSMLDRHGPFDSYGYTTYAIRPETRGLVAWGVNASGQIGDGTTMSPRTLPVDVVGLSDVVQVRAGYHFACAVRASGSVVCWGEGDRGQLGDGSRPTAPRLSPGADVFSLGGVRALSLGYATACAIRADGDVLCWGEGRDGQLGNGLTAPSSRPVRVLGLGPAAQVSVGDAHVCALLEDATVWCWGGNLGGQLGDGTVDPRTTPVRVVDLP